MQSILSRLQRRTSRFGHLRRSSTRSRGEGAIKRCVSATDGLGSSSFASSTVHIYSPGLSSVEHAVKEALASIRAVLGAACHAFLFTTSLPRPLAVCALSAIKDEGIPVAGCSSLQWQHSPDFPTSKAKPSSSEVHTAGAAVAQGQAGPRPLYHISLGAIHVPNAHIHTFQTPTTSLPYLPDLTAALSTRPPQFICFGVQKGTVDIFKDRLENLFSSGSVICAVTGTSQLVPAEQRVGGLAVSSGIKGMEPWRYKLSGVPLAQSGSSSSSRSSSKSSLEDIMAFVGDQVLNVGCCGLMLLPQRDSGKAHHPALNQQSSDSTDPTSSSQSQALLCQTLVGQDRFSSLTISSLAMRHLQPPHTCRWQHVQQRPWSLASASALQDHSSATAQQGTGMLAWRPVATLPANINVHVSSSSSSSSCSSKSESSRERSKTSVTQSQRTAWLRRLPAHFAFPNWSLSQQVHALSSSRVPTVVARLQQDIPVILLGPNFTIFPGEEVQLRILEERYQWLIRQAVDQHGCFAIACAQGMGTVVFVNRYILINNDFYVVVEGCDRVLFDPAQMSTVPGCFGLAAARDALVVQDQTQLSTSEASTIIHTAAQILSLLATSVQAHMKSAENNKALTVGLSFVEGLMQQQRAILSTDAAVTESSDSSSDSGSDSENDEEESDGAGNEEEEKQNDALLLQDYAQRLARHSFDVNTASQFSLALAGVMPLEEEKRRKFMLEFSSKNRCTEIKKLLASYPNLAFSTAGSLMACKPSHLLRQLLSIQDLQPLS